MHDADFDQVFLARHGQTEWNRLGRRQGQLDSPLTVLGKRQAQSLARAVTGLPGIDGVFSSPLGRAAVTAIWCAEVAAASTGRSSWPCITTERAP